MFERWQFYKVKLDFDVYIKCHFNPNTKDIITVNFLITEDNLQINRYYGQKSDN